MMKGSPPAAPVGSPDHTDTAAATTESRQERVERHIIGPSRKVSASPPNRNPSNITEAGLHGKAEPELGVHQRSQPPLPVAPENGLFSLDTPCGGAIIRVTSSLTEKSCGESVNNV